MCNGRRQKESCPIHVLCTYAGKRRKGILVSLLDVHGIPLQSRRTGQDGATTLMAGNAGQYFIRAWQDIPHGVPRATWKRVSLRPGGELVLRFIFNRVVHRGCGSIRIKLVDAYYSSVPLEGGIYQLWQS